LSCVSVATVPIRNGIRGYAIASALQRGSGKQSSASIIGKGESNVVQNETEQLAMLFTALPTVQGQVSEMKTEPEIRERIAMLQEDADNEVRNGLAGGEDWIRAVQGVIEQRWVLGE